MDKRETPAIQIQLEVSRGPKVYLPSFTRVNYRPPGWKLTLLFHVLVNLACAYLGLPLEKKNLSLLVAVFYSWPERKLSGETGICLMGYDDFGWNALSIQPSGYYLKFSPANVSNLWNIFFVCFSSFTAKLCFLLFFFVLKKGQRGIKFAQELMISGHSLPPTWRVEQEEDHWLAHSLKTLQRLTEARVVTVMCLCWWGRGLGLGQL